MYLKAADNNRVETVLQSSQRELLSLAFQAMFKVIKGEKMLLLLNTCWIIKDMDMVALLLGNHSITRGLNACDGMYFRAVVNSFTTFSISWNMMKDEMILNIESEAHLFCLHYVFLLCINRALDLFTCAWNNHMVCVVCKILRPSNSGAFSIHLNLLRRVAHPVGSEQDQFNWPY